MRIGLVGAGPWARTTHAPSLGAHPGVDFVGVWARRPEAAADLGAPVFDSYDAFLAAVDAVAFAVPPAVQSSLAIRAADAGKHIILDKPISENLGAATQLADAVERAGTASIVTLTRRFAPETRAFVAAADAAEWTAGSGTWLSGALLGGEYSNSPWRHDGGALMDVGPHVFDLLDRTLGTVTGVPLARRDEASDSWTVALRHESGVVSTAVLSLRTPVSPSVLRVELSGGDGICSLTDRTTSSTDCFAVLLDEFLQSVDTGVPHECSVRRGLHLQQVIEWVLTQLRR